MAQAPTHVNGTLEGFSDGTWADPPGLGPGDSYDVSTYDPHPSAGQLRAASADYPESLLLAYLTLQLPPAGPQPANQALTAGKLPIPPYQQVLFPAFGQQVVDPASPGTVEPGASLMDSPYEPAYKLARRLLKGTTTPYDYAIKIKGYLDSPAYRYDENPPVSRYPLLTFLFNSKRGYCQQFAGAMALLLRMGGVPSRVATGFTSGSYNRTTKTYVVSDLDAHAWVEAWFPGYGWVRFDPTPAAAPALGGHIQLAPIKNPGAASAKTNAGSHGLGTGGAATPTSNRHGGGGFPVALVVLLVVIALLLAVALRLTLRIGEPTDEELLAELERAFARCGRDVPSGTTLAELERRLRGSPEAQAYVRALRDSRFAGSSQRPSVQQRRALRRQLRAGLGLAGRARAAWALPPRLIVPGRRGVDPAAQ